MVLSKALVFTDTKTENKIKTKLHASNNQQRKAYKYELKKLAYKNQWDVQIYGHTDKYRLTNINGMHMFTRITRTHRFTRLKRT